jgi:Ca-activated chloride channel homolog
VGVPAQENLFPHNPGDGCDAGDVRRVHTVRAAISLRLEKHERRGAGAMRITLRWTLLFLASLAGAHMPQELAISVNVDLVVLQATVKNGKGAVADGLKEENFAVFEDGVRQSIRLFRHEDLAMTAGLVVDHSGSMRTKLADVVAAAQAFVRFSSSEDEMFVVNFNENVSLGLLDPPRFTNKPEELAAAITRTAPSGQTALYDAVIEGLNQLGAGRREKKVLLVISDGADNASRHSLADVLRMAMESNAAIYTIGVFDEDDPDRNPGVLRRLAETTGGEAYVPGGTRDLEAVCERIATGIRRQYTLGFVSNSTAPEGGMRKLRVTAAAPGYGRLSVRTRTGYVARGIQ